jgi:hypothetical protein
MSTEAQRRRTHEAFEEAFGAEVAEFVMEHLSPVPWTDVARQADITGVHAEIQGLRAEMTGGFAAVTGEIAELRGELRSQLPKLIAANIASGVGLVALTISAAKLL